MNHTQIEERVSQFLADNSPGGFVVPAKPSCWNRAAFNAITKLCVEIATRPEKKAGPLIFGSEEHSALRADLARTKPPVEYASGDGVREPMVLTVADWRAAATALTEILNGQWNDLRELRKRRDDLLAANNRLVEERRHRDETVDSLDRRLAEAIAQCREAIRQRDLNSDTLAAEMRAHATTKDDLLAARTSLSEAGGHIRRLQDQVAAVEMERDASTADIQTMFDGLEPVRVIFEREGGGALAKSTGAIKVLAQFVEELVRNCKAESDRANMLEGERDKFKGEALANCVAAESAKTIAADRDKWKDACSKNSERAVALSNALSIFSTVAGHFIGDGVGASRHDSGYVHVNSRGAITVGDMREARRVYTGQPKSPAHATAAKWNEANPVGTPGWLAKDGGEKKATKVTQPAFVSQSGHVVAFFEGVSGYYMAERFLKLEQTDAAHVLGPNVVVP